MNPITVLLADDHALIRESVRALLKGEDGIKVIGEAENGLQAVEAVGRLRPDVVIMDISMPQLNGMEAARQILQAAPGTKVIMLSAHHEDAFVALVMAIGTSGYLNKYTSVYDLPAAIREVHQGGSFFHNPKTTLPPDAHDRGASHSAGLRRHGEPEPADLSPRAASQPVGRETGQAGSAAVTSERCEGSRLKNE